MLAFIGNLLLLLLAALVGLLLLGPLWARIYRLEDSPDEVHYFRAADGWQLSISRRRPEKPVKGREPVILCHGLSANRFNLDFDRTYSLARYLAAEGLDCWVLELRGIGRSARRRLFSPGRFNWSFDDFVRLDAPAAVAHVLSVTGAKRVHWVGHSMGGMIGYGVCQLDAAPSIKSLCAVASPAHFGFHPHLEKLARFKPLLRYIRYVPVRAFAWAVIPFVGRFNLEFERANYNQANMDTVVVRQALASLASPISSPLAAQFLGWIEGRTELIGLDGYNYSTGLAKARMPLLFVAGSVDMLGAPASVRHAFELAGARDKRLRLFGREQGDAMDYGHGDLLVGKTAPYEIFPFVRDWLLEHSTK